MSDPFDREVAVFCAARRLPAGERAAYLEQACAGDAALRQRVEELLSAAEEAGGFLEGIAPGTQRPPDALATPGSLQNSPTIGEKAGDRIGRYKLLQQIGEGGCGVVYMAEQEEPVRRRVALKVIKVGMDTKQVIARFEAERQALALMDHPHIAKVLEAGATAAGRPYFVMELVRGIKITDYCDETKLSTEQRLGLFIQVAQAVQHAHQKGIIHRDLKPSNILVADHDGLPVPKVIDFGIAKATTNQRLTDKTLFTAYEQFIGTPAYISPEQARMSGLDIDTRTDIYSLGVLLYELLTGKTPFDAHDLLTAGLAEMRRTISEQEPARPSTRLSAMRHEELTTTARHRRTDAPKLIHRLRGDLDWMVMKCLEKDRSRRYETANGLANDILRHLNNEPVVARPPSNYYRLQKTFHRNKGAFAAITAVALVLVAGAVVSTWQAVRARRSERAQSLLRAEAQQAEAREAGLRRTAQTEASRAEAAAMDLKVTLSATDFRQAVRLIDEDNAIDALPFLARSLSANPANDAALTRLATLLTSRVWMRPLLILNHESGVTSMEFSPDGRQILTAAHSTGHIWDAGTGRQLTPPLKHQFPVVAAHFSPDGKRIVTASGDKTARFWNAQTGEPLTEPMKHNALLNSAEFSPDGTRIVTGSLDNTFVVWDVETGKLLLGPIKPGAIKARDAVRSSPVQPTNGVASEAAPSSGKGNVYSKNVVGYVTSRDGATEIFSSNPLTARFSPDGKQIITISRGEAARFWDAQTGQALIGPLKDGPPTNSAGLSPEGKPIATASDAKTAQRWDTQDGHSSDGKWVVRVSGGTARIWDARTDQPWSEPLRQRAEVRSARFSPDGKRIVTASADNAAYVWDVRTARPLVEPLKIGGSLNAIEFNPDGNRIVAASLAAVVWDAHTGQLLTEPMKHGSNVLSAQFSPDGKRIVTASRDATARVWDAQSGQPLTEPMKHDMAVLSAEFSPDGKQILTASEDGSVRTWDALTGRPLTRLSGPWFSVASAHFSPDGKQILTGSGDNTARLWDAGTGQALKAPLQHGGQDGSVDSAEFSPDGKRILTASSSRYINNDGIWIEKTARVWDSQTGKPLTAPMKHGNATADIRAAHFSPDGNQIVTASNDGTARVWDSQNGQPLTEPMKHKFAVLSAQFSPDGKRIVTASQDTTARVWDARTGQPLTDPLRHRAVVPKAKFSPAGTQITTVAGSVAMVWDVAPAQKDYPPWLLRLAEAISGQVLNQQGVLEPTRLDRSETLNQIRQQLNQPGEGEWTVWGRWFFADQATRTISPFSRITVPQYIENRIREKTRRSLDEAEELAGDKPEVLLRVSAARDEHIEDLIKQGTDRALEEAEELAAHKPEVLQRISKAREPAVLRANGVDHARHGDFARAAADFARVLELRADDHEVWHWQAATLIQAGQLDRYRALRQKSVERFGQTTDPNTAERIAKDYLILPSTEAGLETAAKMAETAVSAATNHSDMPWFQFAKGLAEYRQGRPGSAIEWMKKVVSNQGDALERDVEAYMVLAMAQHLTGQTNQARVTLAKGAATATGSLPQLDSGDLGDAWLDLVIAHALMREARALIQLPPGNE